MMKTTALLTLTGSGTVMKLWLTQIFTAGVAAPELLLLSIAVAGLGLQTLHSDPLRHSPPKASDDTRANGSNEDVALPTQTEAFSRA
jgi:hypothetical protein